MAFNYFPATYQQNYPQFQQSYPQNQQNYSQAYQQQPSAIQTFNWVQGEAAAKSYLVAPNTTVLLMDSESQKFYIKSADASGMPRPLRSFNYTEVVSAETAPKNDFSQSEAKESQFVTKDEFERFRDKIEDIIKKEEKEVENHE